MRIIIPGHPTSPATPPDLIDHLREPFSHQSFSWRNSGMVGLLGSLLSNQRRMHRRRSSASLRSRIGPGSALCGRDIPGGALTGGTSSARAGTALSITVPAGAGTGAGEGGISGVVVCTTSGSSANNCRRREKSGARSPNVSRAHLQAFCAFLRFAKRCQR